MSRPLAIRSEAVDIVAPLVRGDGLGELVRVTTRSPLAHRRAVYRLARYFRWGSGYDVVPYGFDGDEDDPDHVAFLWVHPEAAYLPDGFRVPCVGAACFRRREAGPALQWAWMHPFYRRQGLLSGAWPEFVAEFGSFEVEGPLSVPMQRFLIKHGHGRSTT